MEKGVTSMEKRGASNPREIKSGAFIVGQIEGERKRERERERWPIALWIERQKRKGKGESAKQVKDGTTETKIEGTKFILILRRLERKNN